MGIKIGNIIPRRLYKGSSLVNRVYKGDALQWERLTREGRSFVSPADGEVSLDTIYGKSLVWNQLASNNAMTVTNCNSQTFDNGYTTLILTNGTTIVRMAAGYAQNGFHPGDKILVISHVKQYNVSNAPFNKLSVKALWDITKSRIASSAVEYMRDGVVAAMHTIVSSVEPTDRIGFYFDVNNNSEFEHTTSDTIVASYNIFNLTKMFGVGNEPSTVEEFEALFPDSYYPYDAGSVLSLGSQSNAIDIDVKGFNLWDEEWEVGGLDSSGQNDSNPNRLRSKNYIECVGGGQYYFYYGGANSGSIFYYDADKNFISSDTAGANWIKTVPTNAAFLRFYIYKSGITTYANDICINLSNPTYNGQYKPYQQEKTVRIPLTTLTSNGEFIFPDGVCGIGTVCDEVGQSKVIKRIGSRPYTAGDEGDSSVMTDGAVTRYVLTSPIEYPLDIPFKVEYKIVEGGSESLVGLTAPIKEDIALNYK